MDGRPTDARFCQEETDSKSGKRKEGKRCTLLRPNSSQPHCNLAADKGHSENAPLQSAESFSETAAAEEKRENVRNPTVDGGRHTTEGRTGGPMDEVARSLRR